MADFAAVWPANRGADTLRGGLLYHRYLSVVSDPLKLLKLGVVGNE